MNHRLLPFFISVVVSVLSSPVSASSNETNQIYLADASDFFNTFKKDVGKAFNDLKDVATGNAERRDNNQTEESTETTNKPAAVQQASSNALTREENREIQKLLIDAGYNPGPADGLPGNKTKVAIRKYQAANGLPIDGEPSITLLDNLKGSPKSTKPVVVAKKVDHTPIEVKQTRKENVAKQETVDQVKVPACAKGKICGGFGLTLGIKFSPSMVKKVISSESTKIGSEENTITYTVIPKITNQTFNSYKVHTGKNSKLIWRIDGIYDLRKVYKSRNILKEKSKTFRKSECPGKAKNIYNVLVNKYDFHITPPSFEERHGTGTISQKDRYARVACHSRMMHLIYVKSDILELENKAIQTNRERSNPVSNIGL